MHTEILTPGVATVFSVHQHNKNRSAHACDLTKHTQENDEKC